jgi:hypothetical protein
MEVHVLQHQANGSSNSRKPYRPPRSSSTSPSAPLNEEDKLQSKETPPRQIPLPFANSTANHYIRESDESDDGDGAPMMINTDMKEDGENDKSDDGEMAIDESSKENDSDGEEATNTLKDQEEPKGNCVADPVSSEVTNSAEAMETEMNEEISSESPKDPMSPEIQVMSSGQAFKPVAGPMSSVTNTVTGPSVLSPPAASLPFGWSWQSGMYPFGMGSGSLPVPTTTFQEDDPLLEPGTNFTLPATVCQESKGGQSLHARSG